MKICNSGYSFPVFGSWDKKDAGVRTLTAILSLALGIGATTVRCSA